MEFGCIRVGGILHNWEVSLLCGSSRVRKEEHWAPPPVGTLKFNVDGGS